MAVRYHLVCDNLNLSIKHLVHLHWIQLTNAETDMLIKSLKKLFCVLQCKVQAYSRAMKCNIREVYIQK